MYRNNLFVNFFFAVFLVSIFCFCQTANAQNKTEANKVEAANQSFYKAFSNKSLKEMDNVWSHSANVTAIHPESKKALVGWKAVKESWESVFKEYDSFKIEGVNPIVHVEGNAAWVTVHEVFQAKQGKKEMKGYATATNIFVKKDGKWLMVLHQATYPPKMSNSN